MMCKIILECPFKVNAGSKVYGRVHCKFCVYENVKEIRVVLKGLELVGCHTHKAKEFFIRRQCLLPRSTVKPGRCEYPFCIDLPHDIPSSFEDHPALVQYILKAIVEIPSNHQEDVLILHVVSLVDLNKQINDITMKPITVDRCQKVGCCCWVSTPIEMSLTLEKNAYILGDTINFKIDVKNNTAQKIESFLVCIKRIFEYKMNESDKKYHSKLKGVIANESLPGIGGNQVTTIYGSINIPEYTELFNFDKCLLIREVFLLNVDAVQNANHVSLETNIYLGHIALTEDVGATGEGLGMSKSNLTVIPSKYSKRLSSTSVRKETSKVSFAGPSVNYPQFPPTQFPQPQYYEPQYDSQYVPQFKYTDQIHPVEQPGYNTPEQSNYAPMATILEDSSMMYSNNQPQY